MPADHCRNFMQAGCYRLNGSAPSWPSPTWVGSHFFFLPMSRRSPFLLTVEAAAGAGIVVGISPRRFGEEAAELVARANIPALVAAIATMAINWNMRVCLASQINRMHRPSGSYCTHMHCTFGQCTRGTPLFMMQGSFWPFACARSVLPLIYFKVRTTGRRTKTSE
jgi:hypothetical protein